MKAVERQVDNRLVLVHGRVTHLRLIVVTLNLI